MKLLTAYVANELEFHRPVQPRQLNYHRVPFFTPIFVGMNFLLCVFPATPNDSLILWYRFAIT